MLDAESTDRIITAAEEFLEKMDLSEMRPDGLKDASDDEIRLAWLRLHQWYGAAKKRGGPVEDIVNAAVWVMREMERRGFEITEDELVEEAKKLGDVAKGETIQELLANLPDEVLLIKDFVSIVGSAAKDDQEPGDIDVLFRAKRDEEGENFLLQADNVWLPVRKALDPEKKGYLHFIDSPQGSHDDYIPCYSLVLRRESPKRKVLKTSYSGYISDRCIEILRKNIKAIKDEDLITLASAEYVEKEWNQAGGAPSPEKVATRLMAILAAKNLDQRGVLEFFAGTHELTRVYKRYTGKVVTVDREGSQDYVMDNLKFIKEHGYKHNDMAIYDFDDQGMCDKTITAWLSGQNPKVPFVITYTHGLLTFKRGARVNTWKKMGYGRDITRKVEAGGDDWLHATENAEKGISNILSECGYKGVSLIALRWSSALGPAGAATYGTWLIEGRV